MPWVIRSECAGPVVVNDINLTFTKGQVRDVDLYGGRENAERSNDLKMLVMKGFLKEVHKDNLPTKVAGDLGKIVEVVADVHKSVNDAATTNSENLGRIAAAQAEMRRELAQHKAEMVDMHQKVLDEIRAFADKHPLQTQTIVQAIRNIVTERGVIAEKMASIKDEIPGVSDADIRAEERMLAIRDRKLEKNLKNIGKSVSESSNGDIADSLKELEGLDLNACQMNTAIRGDAV